MVAWQSSGGGGRHIVWMSRKAATEDFVDFDLKARTGIVTLANMFSVSLALSGVDDIDGVGLDLVDARFPL
jgi:hypothetical protein